MSGFASVILWLVSTVSIESACIDYIQNIL